MRSTYIPYTDNLFVKTETEEHFTAALNAASDADKMKEVVDCISDLVYTGHYHDEVGDLIDALCDWLTEYDEKRKLTADYNSVEQKVHELDDMIDLLREKDPDAFAKIRGVNSRWISIDSSHGLTPLSVIDTSDLPFS